MNSSVVIVGSVRKRIDIGDASLNALMVECVVKVRMPRWLASHNSKELP